MRRKIQDEASRRVKALWLKLPEPPPVLKTVIACLGVLILLHGCSFLLRQTTAYLAMNDEVGFLPFKRPYHHLLHWKAAFYAHVFSSIFVLFAAFTQFVPIRSARIAGLHRLAGRIYVFTVLLVAAPSGAVLACYAEGGLIGRAGFCVLSLLWFATTAAGLAAIRRREIREHLAWMTRSYALTFSAVTFREWQHWLDLILPPNIDLIPITAWLAWVPNLLIAELWIRSRRSQKIFPQTAREWREDKENALSNPPPTLTFTPPFRSSRPEAGRSESESESGI